MRRDRLILVVVVMTLWAVTTAARVRDWQDERRLWAAAAQHAPRKPRPFVNLGRALALEGQHARAAQTYTAAIRLAQAPDRRDAERRSALAVAWINYALLRWQEGAYGDARTMAARAHDLAPQDPVIGAAYAWIVATD